MKKTKVIKQWKKFKRKKMFNKKNKEDLLVDEIVEIFAKAGFIII